MGNRRADPWIYVRTPRSMKDLWEESRQGGGMDVMGKCAGPWIYVMGNRREDPWIYVRTPRSVKESPRPTYRGIS